jgi:uncharacterized membrane protein YkvA (DUF1232 family)
MLELLRLLVIVGGLIIITFMVLLALPQCKLRQICLPFVAFGFAALCAAYAISPVDFMPEAIMGPFGLFDDLGAVVLGVGSAVTAMNAVKQRKKSVGIDPELN